MVKFFIALTLLATSILPAMIPEDGSLMPIPAPGTVIIQSE